MVTGNAQQIHETTSNRMHRTIQLLLLELRVISMYPKMNALTLSEPSMSLAIVLVACSQKVCRIWSGTKTDVAIHI